MVSASAINLNNYISTFDFRSEEWMLLLNTIREKIAKAAAKNKEKRTEKEFNSIADFAGILADDPDADRMEEAIFSVRDGYSNREIVSFDD
ncbi:MAG: hypothetical protein II937_06875 [Bacteroidales bacterium]|nr:hypothetical protein [Bacteroidales bacterium]